MKKFLKVGVIVAGVFGVIALGFALFFIQKFNEVSESVNAASIQSLQDVNSPEMAEMQKQLLAQMQDENSEISKAITEAQSSGSAEGVNVEKVAKAIENVQGSVSKSETKSTESKSVKKPQETGTTLYQSSLGYSIQKATGVTTEIYAGGVESYFFEGNHLFDVIVNQEVDESLAQHSEGIQIAYGEASYELSDEDFERINTIASKMLSSIKK